MGITGAQGHGDRHASLPELLRWWTELSARPPAGPEGEEESRELRERLTSAYWAACLALVESRVGADGRPLTFSAPEKLLLDFGAIDPSRAPAGSDAWYDPAVFDRCLTVSRWLRRQDDDFLEVSRRDQATSFLHRISTERTEIQRQVGELDHSRRISLQGAADDAAALLATLRKREDAGVRASELERDRKRRSLLPPETRDLQACRECLRDSPATLFGKVSEDDREFQLETHRRIIDLRCRDAMLAREEDEGRQAYTRAEGRIKDLLALRKEHLRERVREMRGNVELCRRLGRSGAPPVSIGTSTALTPPEIESAMAVVEEFDPGLFDNARARRDGRPRLLVTPGAGFGSYDFRSNILVLPMTTAGTTLESVAYALALYRKDVDHTENDGRLWRSLFHADVWRKVKTRPMPRGVRKQLEEFVRSYVRWVTRESQGHAVLDDSVRAWFEREIAPDWEGPMKPAALRGRAPEELPAVREATLGRDDPESRYVKAIADFLLGDFDGSLREADALLAADPSHRRALWLRGVVLTLDTAKLREGGADELARQLPARRLAQAREAFQRFLASGESGWWALKAKQHVRDIDERLGTRTATTA